MVVGDLARWLRDEEADASARRRRNRPVQSAEYADAIVADVPMRIPPVRLSASLPN